MMKLLNLFILFTILPIFTYSQDTVQIKITGRYNTKAQEQKPYVILISADGFRYDLAHKYQTPFLLKMSKEGVSAASMRPSFPSLTFPNHYSIITGLYPAHHGIVSNFFYDPSRNDFYALWMKKKVGDPTWYGGMPLWTLAEKQGMLSASFYWVGSESHILNTDPTYYFNYNESIPIEKRIQTVKEWLDKPADTRPHFITFYFPQVDHALHKYGEDSKEAADAALFVDSSMQSLYNTVSQTGLPVNFIFVSDHGMMNTYGDGQIPKPAAIDTSKFKYAESSTIVLLYAKNKEYIMDTYKKLKNEAVNYDVYLANEMPTKWHYDKANDNYGRLGDIILVSHPKFGFKFSSRNLPIGMHGYDNDYPEMHATFYAWGPAFKSHYTIGTFDNVNIYPMIAHILGLNVAHKIDGDFNVLKNILIE